MYKNKFLLKIVVSFFHYFVEFRFGLMEPFNSFSQLITVIISFLKREREGFPLSVSVSLHESFKTVMKRSQTLMQARNGERSDV